MLQCGLFSFLHNMYDFANIGYTVNFGPLRYWLNVTDNAYIIVNNSNFLEG